MHIGRISVSNAEFARMVSRPDFGAMVARQEFASAITSAEAATEIETLDRMALAAQALRGGPQAREGSLEIVELEPGVGDVRFGSVDDLNDDTGFFTGLFTVQDPVQNRRLMGIGRVNLAAKSVDYTVIGPAQAVSFVLAPARDKAYGLMQQIGRYEFWTFDLKAKKLASRIEFTGRPRMALRVSSNGKLLYVANAHRNTVTVIDTDSGGTTETIWAALYPQSPPGATPNSLALTPDEKLLFVANANINTLAVVDVSVRGKSRSLGFIPTGWYPTSVRVTPDGKIHVVGDVIQKMNLVK